MTAAGVVSIATARWCLVVAVVLSNAANFVIASANHAIGMTIDAVLSVPLVISLALYGGAFVLYSRCLSRIPVSVAYPIFIGITLIFVAAASFIWFDHPLSVFQLAGLGLVFLGVFLVSTSTDSSGTFEVDDDTR